MFSKLSQYPRMFRNLTIQTILIIVFFPIYFFICSTPSLAGWSSPLKMIYPKKPENISFSLPPPKTAAFPFITNDQKGNFVSVWFDSSGTGSMLGATLAPGAINEKGQPAWKLTQPIATANVVIPYDFYAQCVGMDKKGNATAIWSDGTYVYASILPFGKGEWSPPRVINEPSPNEIPRSLNIAVAENGNKIITWISSTHPYDGNLYANVYLAKEKSWLGQTNLLGNSHEFHIDENQISIDPRGNGIVLVGQNSSGVQAVSYIVKTNTWNQIPSIATNPIISFSSAMDSHGNGVIVWIEEDSTMHGATLPYYATAFSNSTLLSINANTEFSSPQVISNRKGDAVTMWTQGFENLASARYSFKSGLWSFLPLINLKGVFPTFVFLSGDPKGNVVASWTNLKSEETTQPLTSSATLNFETIIQAATLATYDSSWQQISKLSNYSGNDFNSKVALSKGNAVVVCENNLNTLLGTIKSSNYLNIFSPVVESVDADSKSSDGKTSVLIKGANFHQVKAVYFGKKQAKKFKVDSPTQIKALAPKGWNGKRVTVKSKN